MPFKIVLSETNTISSTYRKKSHYKDVPYFLKDILLRLIYTLKHVGISSSYQKVDEIHFSVRTKKSMLTCAIIGYIVTYMKSGEKNFLLFISFNPHAISASYITHNSSANLAC